MQGESLFGIRLHHVDESLRVDASSFEGEDDMRTPHGHDVLESRHAAFGLGLSTAVERPAQPRRCSHLRDIAEVAEAWLARSPPALDKVSMAARLGLL